MTREETLGLHTERPTETDDGIPGVLAWTGGGTPLFMIGPKPLGERPYVMVRGEKFIYSRYAMETRMRVYKLAGELQPQNLPAFTLDPFFGGGGNKNVAVEDPA